ncbi:helix-turn-helix domain-containing protein [Nocardia terpenica]|nr:helix-turn-helix domain-containing protein [Nocardia terpenica]MBF6061412.1 helix-turn-helix domain-containing protein [Nocardia terpenica]MBF6105359.1 helix-turn-helix domain-containing protein [Nocardia terpenica]MBF6113171.1 helix-turn-helix domain-containing protein [Nocardia terpenica]MBF6119301.1 helix-turn-helix domain-containing protein [Nocardia terpenica]MBF6152949.1 helix-turn-helix domain-containing protein [Nocardia terpenica]
MTEAETDGQLLRRLREQAGLSLNQLSEAAHYDKGYLSRLENDRQSLSETVADTCDQVLGTGGLLAARAQAAAARDRRRSVLPVAQLPSAPTSLVGRSGPLVRVAELLATQTRQSRSVPAVCIDGPPGVGKTALALTYAHSIAGDYPGGALFADLRGYGGGAGAANPAEILDRFLRALGVHPDRIPADPDERSALFRSMVHGRGILVVLDNAGDSIQVRPLLPGSPDCAVLVTSRQRLSGLLAGCLGCISGGWNRPRAESSSSLSTMSRSSTRESRMPMSDNAIGTGTSPASRSSPYRSGRRSTATTSPTGHPGEPTASPPGIPAVRQFSCHDRARATTTATSSPSPTTTFVAPVIC